MRQLKIFLLLLLMPMLCALSCEKKKVHPIEVTIDKNILEQLDQKRPKDVFVYEILPGEPRRWMNTFSGLLSLRGEMKESNELITMKEGPRYLEVRKISCSVFQGDMNQLWKEEPSPDSTQFDVPNNEEAQRVAVDWLQRFGFSSNELKDLSISVSDESFEITLPDRRDNPIKIVTGKNVEVRRKIDNLTVYGPGSKIKFYIGGKSNKVNGMMIVWRQFTPQSAVFGHNPRDEAAKGSKTSVLKARQAFKILQNNPLDHLPLALVYKIAVDKVEFGYYERSATEDQKYLQPVYVFRGVAYSKLPDGREVNVPYTQYVLALKKPFESIWSDTRDLKSENRGNINRMRGKDDQDEK